MMKTRTIMGMILILFTLLVSACGSGGGTVTNDPAVHAQANPTSTPVPTAEIAANPTYVVERGTVENVFTFTGRWQPRDQMTLSFPNNGTVRQVNVQRGDAVSTGDLLADYDISDLENQLANARISLETAQTNVSSGTTSGIESVENAEISLANARISLQNTLDNSPWTNVASSRISLESAQRSLEDAERSYLEALSHPDQPASTVDNAYQQMLSAHDQVRSAEISYFSAAQSYNNHQYSVQQAQNSVIQAELGLQRAIDAAAGGVNDESVRSTQLNIDQLEKDIAESSLYAPIDGVILDVYIAPGDNVAAYDTVIVIGLPEPKEVIATLAIADTNNLSVGMTGKCQIINQPETAVGCVVRSIPLNSLDADQTTRVAASLENVTEN
ncbi:MAG: biotin/lipoyl-binding protein [Anaerolineae bacterium]|nr:biotin/lipoyl-binding protein [Anaerolineae bacterium]